MSTEFFTRILSINYHKKTFISGDFDGMLLFSERKKNKKIKK